MELLEPNLIEKKYIEKSFKIKKECIALNNIQEKELLEIAYTTNTKHGLIIELALNTSLRVNELCNLIISNLHLDKNESYIQIADRNIGQYNDSFKCKTELSNRMNPLTRELADKLKLSLNGRKTGYVFQSQVEKDKDFPAFTKKSLINMINHYAKLCPSISKPIGFHATRRTYASKLLAQNIPINQIMLALGHSSIQTTFKYLKSIRQIDLNLIRNALKEI